MNPNDIGVIDDDGQAVYFRRGHVIANSEDDIEFVKRFVDPVVASEQPPDGDFQPVRLDLRGLSAEEIVGSARQEDASLTVQFDHVLFGHCQCGCGGPCCGANPQGQWTIKATPFKATPFKATPFKATPHQTSAETTAATQFTAVPQAASSEDVVVWILDTGAAASNHKTPVDTLVDPISHRTDRPNEVPTPLDYKVDPVAGHGTFIAGIIHELARGCKICVADVMDGWGDVSEQDAATQIDTLVAQGLMNGTADHTILNLSFGGAMQTDGNFRLRGAIEAAQRAGMVVVASAGNDGSCRPVYPGNFADVVAVGALDHDGDPASFTNRGDWVDACALGVDIVSTFFDFTGDASLADLCPKFTGGWAVWSGTSFAAPVVSAAIAQEMTSTGTTAVAAKNAVLAAGQAVPCLGVRVSPAGTKQLAEDARP